VTAMIISSGGDLIALAENGRDTERLTVAQVESIAATAFFREQQCAPDEPERRLFYRAVARSAAVALRDQRMWARAGR